MHLESDNKHLEYKLQVEQNGSNIKMIPQFWTPYVCIEFDQQDGIN